MERGFQRVRAQSSQALQEGAVVGGYVLVALLASGLTSELWLARTLGGEDTAPSFALKVTHINLSGDAEFLRRFRAGAEVQAKLEHSGTPRTVDLGLDQGRCFVVTEYVPGRSLRQILHRGSTLGRVPPVWFSLAVLVSACDVLDYIDRRLCELGAALPWASRGIRPEHILVSVSGETRLVELLLPSARDSAELQSRRLSNLWDMYLAPELLDGAPEASVGPRADVYSVGLVLYEMVTGERPDRTLPRPFERPSRKAPWAGVAIDEIVARATHQDPGHRYRNVVELGAVLGRHLANLGVQPSPKHIAQQVCGLISHPECEPPQSARLGGFGVGSSAGFPSSSTLLAATPASAPPISAEIPSAEEERISHEMESPSPEDAHRPPSGVHSSSGSWDVAVARARGDMQVFSGESAAELFEAGLEHLRNRDYKSALKSLGRAVELQPENRVYVTNLRKLKKQLGAG